jgi:hypothetical protein
MMMMRMTFSNESDQHAAHATHAVYNIVHFQAPLPALLADDVLDGDGRGARRK